MFDRYYDTIHGYVARCLGQVLADDVASETFLTAFARRDRYDLSPTDAEVAYRKRLTDPSPVAATMAPPGYPEWPASGISQAFAPVSIWYATSAYWPLSSM